MPVLQEQIYSFVEAVFLYNLGNSVEDVRLLCLLQQDFGGVRIQNVVSCYVGKDFI